VGEVFVFNDGLVDDLVILYCKGHAEV